MRLMPRLQRSNDLLLTVPGAMPQVIAFRAVGAFKTNRRSLACLVLAS